MQTFLELSNTDKTHMHMCFLNQHIVLKEMKEFPGGTVNKNLLVNSGEGHRFNPWSRKISHAKEQLKPVVHSYWSGHT